MANLLLYRRNEFKYPASPLDLAGLKKGVDIEREDAFFLILYGKIESTRKLTSSNSTLTRGGRRGIYSEYNGK